MAANPVHGLDQACSVCGRVSGEHTLREWAACIGATTVDLGYEPVPEDAARIANERLRENFDLPADWLIADNIIAKAVVMSGSAGAVGYEMPLVVHEFSVAAGGGMVPVATVAYIGPPETLRKYGRLLRDTANGAANAAERRAA